MEEEKIGGNRVERIISIYLKRKKKQKLKLQEGEQDFIALAQFNGAFKFLIPILIGAVQVCVQDTTKYPLETHPANVYTFLLATFIYCFALTADSKCKTHHTTNTPDQIFGLIAFISGSLASVSLVSIIVPRWCGYVIFILWALVSVFVAHRHATLIQRMFLWLLRRIKDTWLCKICHKVSNLRSNQDILPM